MKYSNAKDKLLEILFEFPTKEFHLRELSRIAELSTPSVAKAVNGLKDENIVSIKKAFLLKIKANLDNEQFKQLKRVSNLKKVYLSGLFNYLKNEYPLSTIILFGSYSRGEDNEKSDIDIAIIDKEKNLELDKYEEIFGKKINVEFINLKNLTNELRNSIINGILLQGYIEI